jgi:hypothetical protein
VYRGDDEDDFLYCLPDSKEVNVCREIIGTKPYVWLLDEQSLVLSSDAGCA